jgi:hypothetical protein
MAVSRTKGQYILNSENGFPLWFVAACGNENAPPPPLLEWDCGRCEL